MPSEGEWLCTAEGEGLPGWFPPFWIAYNDQSDPVNGVHCNRITAPGGAAARAVLRYAEKVIGL